MTHPVGKFQLTLSWFDCFDCFRKELTVIAVNLILSPELHFTFTSFHPLTAKITAISDIKMSHLIVRSQKYEQNRE